MNALYEIYVAFCTRIVKFGLLQQAGVRDCYRTFAKLLHSQSRNITSLSWMQLKFSQIKRDKYLGLGFSGTIFKIKLLEMFDNDSNIQKDHAESKRCFIVKQMI